MSSLLATHTAIRVAREVGYPEVPLDRVTCPNCGQELDWIHPADGFVLSCPECRAQTTVPCHLRAHVDRPMPDGPPLLARFVAWLRPEGPDYSSPRWLTLLFVSCLVAVGIAVVTTIVKVGAAGP